MSDMHGGRARRAEPRGTNQGSSPPLPWKALLLAPLASIPAAVLAGLGSSDAGIVTELAWAMEFALTIAAPLSYLGMALVGLPIYLLLRKTGLLRAWILVTIGIAVPLVLFATTSPLRITVTTVACGLAVSVAAWLLLPAQARAASGGHEG